MAMMKQSRIKSSDWKRTAFIVGMLALPLLQFAIFFLYVNVNTIRMSFKHISGATGEITPWSIQNYVNFFNELSTLPRYGRALKNSLLFGANDLLLLTISVIFAYFFYKKVRGAKIFRIIFFLPSIISIVIFVMVYKFMFNPNTGNLVGKILGLVMKNPPDFYGGENQVLWITTYCLWVGTGYNILIMGGAMGNLPEDVMEYSRLEGVGYAKELFLIVIPMIWPTISVGILSAFTTMFTLYLQVDLLGSIHGSNIKCESIAYIINSKVKSGQDLEMAATIGVCFTIFAIPFLIVVRKLLDKVNQAFEG